MCSLPNVSGYEKGDPRAQAISLLQKFIQAYHNDSSKAKLEDYENSIPSTKLADTSIHPRHHVGNSLTDSNQDAQQLLCPISARKVEEL